jgi:hypothetical protein
MSLCCRVVAAWRVANSMPSRAAIASNHATISFASSSCSAAASWKSACDTAVSAWRAAMTFDGR